MKPISWDWDFLIHRHLSGGLTEEQRGALNEGLRAEPRLRRRLAEMAFEQAVVRELEGRMGSEAAVGTGAATAAPLLKPASPESLANERKTRKGKGKRRGKTGGDQDGMT